MSTLKALPQLQNDTTPPSSDLRSGTVLGRRYRIMHTLATGGMATIYEAHDIPLERLVVLKVLRVELARMPEIVERFLNEARSLAKLHSSHVTRVLDCGNIHQASAPDLPFIVLELLDGIDLWATLRQSSRLSAALTARYMLEACEGLAEVHALGIVHRDIKPENIFLAREVDGTQTVKLLDFGISKTLDQAGAGWHTQSCNIFGSPLYMSPEQMRAMPVDARTDIWGLGAVMFECVAGQPAFGGSTVFEISAQVLSEPMTDLRNLNSELSESFVRIVERCLQRNPAHRYQTVAELAQALEPLAVSSSVSPATRIACLLGLDAPKPALELPVSEPMLNSINTNEPTPRRTARVRGRRIFWLSVVSVIVALLGSSCYRHPAIMTRALAEARHRASSLLAPFSR